VFPTFSDGGDIICHVPPLFRFRFCTVFGEVSNMKVTFVTFCVKSFMLDVTHSRVIVETEFGLAPLIRLFYKF